MGADGHALPFEATPQAPAALGPLWVGDPLPNPYRIAAPVSAVYGGALELLGYDLASGDAMAGTPLSLSLYWQALVRVPHDYTVFVHLCDDAGTPLAQSDGQPIDGALPTSLWLPKIVVRDERTIDLPAALPPGAYHLRVGLYRLETMERLEVIAPQHAVADRAVELTTVTVR